MKPSLPIVELEAPSLELFNRDYVIPGAPLILRKIIDDIPARKWNLKYLVEKVGSTEVHIRKNTNTEDYRVRPLPR